jgi:selenocysteine lyase/cysteine desulfurase
MAAVRAALLASLTPYKLRAAPDEDPDRWESGTQNHEAMAGTIAAIDYIAEVGGAGDRRDAVRRGYAAFEAHERELAARFLEGIADIPKTRLIGIADPSRLHERTPTFAVRVGDQHPMETSRLLGERGIFTWEGHYYAIEVFERLGLLETGGALRIGFCHYHTLDEVDRVLTALADLAR